MININVKNIMGAKMACLNACLILCGSPFRGYHRVQPFGYGIKEWLKDLVVV